MRGAAVVMSVVLLAAIAGQASAGQAKSSFRVGLTIGQAGGWAPADRPSKSYTWNAAAISVRKAGFDNVAQVDTSGGIYWFEAERQGHKYRVAVSVTTGNILDVISIGG